MRCTRIYIDSPELGQTDQCILGADESHRLKRVLRLKPGSELKIFNGRGSEYSAQLLSYQENKAHLQLHNPIKTIAESPLHTTLWLGISRGDRMDYAIQKSVELGINCIRPVFTRYSEVKLSGARLERKMQHWRGIIISACEQCGRNSIPDLILPSSLSEILDQLNDPKTHSLRLLLAPNGIQSLNATNIQEYINITVLVRPEGGLSEEEINTCLNKNFTSIRLGKRILRTETAPVAILSILQMLAGDLS